MMLRRAPVRKTFCSGVDRAVRLDGVDLAQHAHHIGPELAHRPFVIEKAAPAEHAFAEIVAGQAQGQAQRLQLFVDLVGQHGRDHAVAGARRCRRRRPARSAATFPG